MDPDSDPDPDADPDSATFAIDLQEANKTQIFFIKLLSLLFFEGTLTSFSKDKKSKRSHKTVDLKVFLTIFA
jgi:hypothetical protein